MSLLSDNLCIYAKYWRLYDSYDWRWPYTRSIDTNQVRMCLEWVTHIIRYKTWNNKTYACAMTLPAIAYGVMCITIAALCASSNIVDAVVPCIPPTAFRGASMTFWVVSNMIICVAVISIFAVAYNSAKKSGERDMFGKRITNHYCRFWWKSELSVGEKQAQNIAVIDNHNDCVLLLMVVQCHCTTISKHCW
jgi:hypothetical protein